jgi:hypothetical protein
MIGTLAKVGICIGLFQIDGIPPPDLQSIAPMFGPVAGGNTITLHGNNFQMGATATFDTNTVATTFQDAMTLTATAPAHVLGPVDVTVTNPDSQSSTLPLSYTYRGPVPTCGGSTPSSGTVLGSRRVTIAGNNFAAGATVTFGGVAALGTPVVRGPMAIEAITPPHAAPGPVNIVVTNIDGQSCTRTNGYTYTLLTITSITPNVSPTQGGTPFVLRGMNIGPGSRVFFQAGTADTTIGVDLVVVNDTTLTGFTPPHIPGNVDLILAPPTGTLYDTIVGGFAFHDPPTVGSLSPTSGHAGGNTPVTVRGLFFVSGATVAFGGTSASVSFVSSTQLDVVTPAHAPGTVNVVVANPDGLFGTLPASFTFGAAPRLDSVDPNSGLIAGGTPVTVRGVNFQPGATVSFRGVSATTSFVDGSTLMTIAPPNDAGTVDVTVTNPDLQSWTLPAAFNYGGVPPVLAGMSPRSSRLSGGIQVTLNGSNFLSGADVYFGGVRSPERTVNTATITATAPPHAAGKVDVTVVNPDLQSSGMPASFSYTIDGAPPTDPYIDPSTVGPKACGSGPGGALPSVFAGLATLIWLSRRARRTSARH